MEAPVTPPLSVPSDVFERMIAMRRDLHQHPELSWKEERTAQRVGTFLSELGLAPERIAGTGVVAEIAGRTDGPVIALRADLDALPIQEETGLPFASVNQDVMHACGHDGHTAILAGAAELLLACEPPPVPIRLIWQPAEEKGSGSRALIDAGALDRVGMIFGGHVDRHFRPGVLAVTDGPVNASTDMFCVEIEGQQGHGARPHEGVDAVVVGSLLVTALQTIVSREVDPASPSVVSIGSFKAGSASNVIAGHAILEGTIRAQDRTVRDHLCEAVKRIAQSVGQLHGAKVTMTLGESTPALINPPEPTALARRAAEEVVGHKQVHELRGANMGGEDFAWYLDEVPGCYIRFGAQVRGREGYPAHSSRFEWDEIALATGAGWFARVARLAGEHMLREGNAIGDPGR